jgi:hypothetical protein
MPSKLGYSSDGAIWAAKLGSEASRYLGNGVWVIDRQDMRFSALSVGSKANVYGISRDKLYAFVTDDVRQLDPTRSVVYVSVSAFDGALWGLDFHQNACFYDGKNWTDGPPGAPQMTQLSVVDKHNVIGAKPNGAPLQRWDGSSWTQLSLSSPVDGMPCKTYFACGARNATTVNLFSIDEWKDKNATVHRAIFRRVLDADTWAEQSRTQLAGMMQMMSAAVDSRGNATLWGWNADPDTYNGVYGYDFRANNWVLLGSDYSFPAAVPGGGFVVSGYGSGLESVLRTEIAGALSAIPMPFRQTITVVSAKNENEFYAASSDGASYHWAGLGWVAASPPEGTIPVSLSVAEDGSVWVVDKNGVVWERVQETWKSHGGTFEEVSANRAGHAYASTDLPYKLFRMSAESDGWTEISLPAERWSTVLIAASSDDTCTLTSSEGKLYRYDAASGQWTMTQDTGISFFDMSAQDENHLFGRFYGPVGTDNYWVGTEAPPTVVAEQTWEGTDFSGDEWAGWFGFIP